VTLVAPCPECASDRTRWLEHASRAAAVDYFRCDACGAVWVVGHAPNETHQITTRPDSPAMTELPDVGVRFLFADVETGLLFAEMALSHPDADRRSELRSKARMAYETALRLTPTVSMPPEQEARVLEKLTQLRAAIDASAA
jgi:hypothetical protein